MEWLKEIITSGGIVYSCVIISIVSAIGIALGKIKFFGISLGVSFVFFIGIVAGHFGMSLPPNIAEFIQSFGLSLFVFTLGMQVGPSFFSSMRSGGLTLNLLAMLVALLNIAMAVLISVYAGIPMTEMIGVLSGAVTNTPALGAAQQSLAQITATAEGGYDMAYACAVTYPFGVIGAIIVLAVLNSLFGRHVKKINESNAINANSNPLLVGIIIKNSEFTGVKISQLQTLTKSKLIVTRIIRNEIEITTNPQTEIKLNDTILITVLEINRQRVINLLGEERTIEWNTLKSELISRKIFVTRSEVNGKSIEALQIRKNYNVNITKVSRGGIFLIAQNDLKLFIGDKVILVGEQKNVKCVEDLLGNAIKKIDEPHLFTIFIGIAMGIILGSIPLTIPGISVPIKMGLASGTIIMGILVGSFGYKFKLNTFTTTSANLMLRELGIVLYLASLGIASGRGFVESLVSGNGIEWLIWGALITVVPMLLVGFIAIKYIKRDIPSVMGMLSGSMSNATSLLYATQTTGQNTPTVAYATVYPLTVFIRVVTAQILVMMFL